MGPEGPAGPGTRLVITATLNDSGIAMANLPTEAGTLQNPPGLTCYLSDTPAGPFLVIGTDLDGPVCALGQQGGALVAFVSGGAPGWIVQFVVLY
jgi:hypothetical protein